MIRRRKSRRSRRCARSAHHEEAECRCACAAQHQGADRRCADVALVPQECSNERVVEQTMAFPVPQFKAKIAEVIHLVLQERVKYRTMERGRARLPNSRGDRRCARAAQGERLCCGVDPGADCCGDRVQEQRAEVVKMLSCAR